MQLQDLKYAKLLFQGATAANVDDMEFQWLGSVITGTPDTNTVQDRWHEYWDQLLIPPGNYEDRAFAWLTSLNHLQPSLQDKWYAYWGS